MKKILYISPYLDSKSYGGSIVSKNNLNALRSLPGLDVIDIRFSKEVDQECYGKPSIILPANKNNLQTAMSCLMLYPFKIGSKTFRKIQKIINEECPNYIYFDSSIWGGLCKWIKLNHPEIIIISFFQNIEYDFEIQRLKSGYYKFIPSFISVFFNEKKSTKYSDYIFALHKTDSNRLMELYGREANCYIPVTCAVPGFYKVNFERKDKLRIGFIGSAFYSNIEAAFYINKLAQLVDTDKFTFSIAGRGFDKYKHELELTNLLVLGEVSSIDAFYKDIDIFLSPITSGGGMKVKIAEAMSYNLPIIASSFSLIGYEKHIDGKNIISCDNESDYLVAIHNIEKCEKSFISKNREQFLSSFTETTITEIFGAFFRGIKK